MSENKKDKLSEEDIMKFYDKVLNDISLDGVLYNYNKDYLYNCWDLKDLMITENVKVEEELKKMSLGASFTPSFVNNAADKNAKVNNIMGDNMAKEVEINSRDIYYLFDENETPKQAYVLFSDNEPPLWCDIEYENNNPVKAIRNYNSSPYGYKGFGVRVMDFRDKQSCLSGISFNTRIDVVSDWNDNFGKNALASNTTVYDNIGMGCNTLVSYDTDGQSAWGTNDYKSINYDAKLLQFNSEETKIVMNEITDKQLWANFACAALTQINDNEIGSEEKVVKRASKIADKMMLELKGRKL